MPEEDVWLLAPEESIWLPVLEEVDPWLPVHKEYVWLLTSKQAFWLPVPEDGVCPPVPEEDRTLLSVWAGRGLQSTADATAIISSKEARFHFENESEISLLATVRLLIQNPLKT
jgi:hypothetical protein